MSTSGFKVIVIGGGPAGLTAAHALYHAGIDFVVLERREHVFEDTGASLVLFPHNLRVLHQFGILDDLLDQGAPIKHLSQGFRPQAKTFKRTTALGLLEHNHGAAIHIFHRAHALRVLYDTLPQEAKTRYFTDKKVVDIHVRPSGVDVKCLDGTSYPGTIVIGADGVYSITRSIMRRLALEANSSLQLSWDPEIPFYSYYRCLWASFKRPTETEAGLNYETQGPHRSAVYLSGREKSWIFLYEKLPDPTKSRIKFDKEATRAFAESFADWTLHETLKVRDVISQESFVAGMADLEEGIANNKSWGGRIVLVGDACHKFTPNAGLGFNNGVQDLVSLCNRLQQAAVNVIRSADSDPLDESSASALLLDAETLQRLFEEYEEERAGPLKADYKGAGDATRLAAWADWIYYILAKYILPWGFVRNYITTSKISEGIAGALVLDYIPTAEPFSGIIPWKHPLKKPLGVTE